MSNSSARATRRARKAGGSAPKKAAPAPIKAAPKRSFADVLGRKKVNKK